MRNYLLLITLVFLAACGSGSGGGAGGPIGSTTPTGSVSGTSFDGLVLGGTVSAYDFSTGAKGALLGQATTDNSTGLYSLSLQVESRPVLLELTGGYYIEEAGVPGSGTQVALLTGQKLTVLTNYTTGGTLNASVTTYTHIAAGLAAYEISHGTAVATAINDANERVSSWAGVNILTTTPKEITDVANASATLTPELRYGFLAGAISMWTYNNMPSGAPQRAPWASINFAQLIYQDISADGLLDGVALDSTGARAQLSFGNVPLNQKVYRQGIGISLLQIAANQTINKIGLTPSNTPGLLGYAEAYAGNMDLMFGGVPPVSITTPTISITQPTGLGWLSGSQTVSANVQDYAGLSSDSLAIDGGSPQTLTANLNTPSWALATATLSGGTHTATVSATNVAGLTASASVTFQVDNVPPTIALNPSPSMGTLSCSVSGSVAGSLSGPANTATASWATTQTVSLVNNTFSFTLPTGPSIFYGGSYSAPVTITATNNAGVASTVTKTLSYQIQFCNHSSCSQPTGCYLN